MEDIAGWNAAGRQSESRSFPGFQAAEGMMSNNRVLLTTCGRSLLLAVFALGLASTAQAQQAQSEKDKPAAAPASEPSAADAKPSSVEGVTVNAQRPPSGLGVPPDKAAAYAEEVAKNKAWGDYRKSTPPLTSDPNDQSKDFPGLQTYVPKQ